jgi:hypothetical protein
MLHVTVWCKEAEVSARVGRQSARGRWLSRGALILCAAAPLVHAGPIEVYRTGPRYCPRGFAAEAGVLTEAQAIERARKLLPDAYCGPSAFVSGCDVLPEYSLNSWRIYFHQYRAHDAQHDWGGLTHTYIVLDAVGNCDANIPGTEEGAPR